MAPPETAGADTKMSPVAGATAWAHHDADVDATDKSSGVHVAQNQASSTDGDGDDDEQDHNQRPECFSSTAKEILFVLSCMMATAQAAFFNGTVVGLTATIGADLHMTSAEITWISASNSLSAGAFLLFFGKLADMFGRKPMFVASMGLSSVVLLIIGFSKSAIFMDCFCGCMGLCSAAMVPPAVGTLGAVYGKPSRRKNLAFGCFSAGNPLGFVFGAVMSGIASKIFSWRASFWLLAIIYAVFTILTLWAVPTLQTQARMKLNMESFKRFDIVGTVLVVMGIAMFSSSLSLSGDAPAGWKTSYVIALLVIGLILIGCFIYWQHVFKFPLMPLYVWKDRNFSLLILITCAGYMNFSSNSFWVALYLQRVKHSSALEVAAQMLPQAVSGIVVNAVVALILHRFSNKILMGISTVSYTASALLYGFMREDISYWALMFPSLILSVIGADIQFSVTNMYVMSSLPPAEQSLAGGIFNTAIRLCQNVGLGITTAIYESVAGGNGIAGTAIKPYSDTFHYGTAIVGASIFLVPFLTVGTQGGKRNKTN